MADGVSLRGQRRAGPARPRPQRRVVLVKDLEEGVAAVNALAPEHVEVMTQGRPEGRPRDRGRGGVRRARGRRWRSGTTASARTTSSPPAAAARFASPLSVRDFQRRQSVVTMTRAGLARVAEDVVRVAAAEGFRGHAQSVLTRFEGE